MAELGIDGHKSNTSLGPYKESDCKFRMTEEYQRKNAMEEMQWV